MKDLCNDWRWSTHQPLNELVVSFFEPELIVELGGGIYSTPIFINKKPKKFICIENDGSWIEFLKKEFDFIYPNELREHKLRKHINKGTFVNELKRHEKQKIYDYYLTLGEEVNSIKADTKFLFVDNFTCCRSIAINTLYENFDIIAYHDCEPNGVPWYDYKFNKALINNFHHYYMITSDSWTGLFVNKNKKYNKQEFQRQSISFVKKYKQENNIKHVFLKKTDL
jgi:hypothetical protein